MPGTDAINIVVRAGRPVAALLAVLLVMQRFVPIPDHELRTSASWTNLATSLDEAKALSNVIVLGHVDRVAAGSDIVVLANGEPGGVDRVGAEVVRIVVDRTYKGEVPGAIPLFHTALERTDATPAPLPSSVSPPPNGRVPAPPTEGETRRVILDGDPPYEPGEHYVLFLTRGPTIDGVSTLAVIAPEGRYLLDWPGTYSDNSHLHAVTKRGFAPQYDDQPVRALFAPLGPPAPSPSPRPKNVAGRRSTLEIIGGAAAAAGLGVILGRGHGHQSPSGDPTGSPPSGDPTGSSPSGDPTGSPPVTPPPLPPLR